MSNDDLKTSVVLYWAFGVAVLINGAGVILATLAAWPWWLRLWYCVAASYFFMRWWHLGLAVLREKLRRGLL